LDGDIFGLGPDAGVDAIRNLRWIIQGYLEGAYAYSQADAAVLAEFITVYNAVYRKNREYFSSRYKTPLMENMVPPGIEGLSTHWREWAGQTLMLIPLRTAKDGSLGAVETSAITSSEVINEMRKEEDRGIEQRQAMVDLKEREADEAFQQADLKREEIKTEELRIAEEERRVAEERANLEQQKSEGLISEDEAVEKEAALETAEEKIEQSKEELQELREEERETREVAELKMEEAQAERREISADQAEILNIAAAAPPQAAPSGILAVRLNPGSSGTGRIVRVNPDATGQIMQSSSLNTLNARTVTFIAGKIIACSGGGKCALVEISADALLAVKQGEDEINKDSLIWVNGQDLYAISVSGGKNYISRFDTNLARQASSSVEVHPLASVVFSGGKLLTQKSDGSVLIVNPSTLAE
jgi:hypothetical protein